MLFHHSVDTSMDFQGQPGKENLACTKHPIFPFLINLYLIAFSICAYEYG